MKKLSVLFAAVMMVVSVGMAKAQKIATLDVLGVLNAMPEKKKADADLKTFLDTKQAEIKKKQMQLKLSTSNTRQRLLRKRLTKTKLEKRK